MNRRAIFRWATPVVLGVLAIAVVYGRFTVEAGRALASAEAARARGDDREATRAYLDALRAYVPGSPIQRRALDGLEALAAEARRARDDGGERAAWEAVRAGLLGARSLYVPNSADLREANNRLETLLAATPVAPDPRRRGNGGYLPRRRPLPSPGRVIATTFLSLLGFAMWVGAVVLLIRRGLDGAPAAAPPHGSSTARRPPRAHARFPFYEGVLLPALFIAGFALFLLGTRLG